MLFTEPPPHKNTHGRPPFTLPATLPVTRIFFYYPTRTLPEVKKTYPSQPGHGPRGKTVWLLASKAKEGNIACSALHGIRKYLNPPPPPAWGVCKLLLEASQLAKGKHWFCMNARETTLGIKSVSKDISTSNQANYIHRCWHIKVTTSRSNWMVSVDIVKKNFKLCRFYS